MPGLKVTVSRRSALLLRVIVGLALALLLTSPARAEEKKRKIRPLGISVFPPLALFNSTDTVIIGPSINLIYGHSRAVYGVEVGVVNRVEKDVGLLQLGGLANIVGGGCYGICAAGLLNLHGKLNGAQLALFGNDAGSAGFGIQVGLLNAVRRNGDLVIQVGMINFNNRRVEDMAAALGAQEGDVITIQRFRGKQRGIQIGIANGSEDYRGIQFGFVNLAKGKGVQIGVINISDRYAGVQAGAWNHATKMHGLQIGFVNTARSLKGVQLGIINVATKNKLPFTVIINAGF